MAELRVAFVAIAPATWGEAATGIELATALAARGRVVRVFVPSTLARLVEGSSVATTTLPVHALAQVLRASLAEFRPDVVVLVDALAVMLNLPGSGLRLADLTPPSGRVVALDLWNLDEAGATWDLGDVRIHLPAAARALPRIVPAPLARPSAPNAYAALPAAPTITKSDARTALGFPTRARIVLFGTSVWQDPSLFSLGPGTEKTTTDALAVWARLFASRADTLLVHVGPRPFQILGAALGTRYRFSPALAPPEFAVLAASCDLLLTGNVASTLVARAIAARCPVLLTTGAFRVWPAGLRDFLAPVLATNPLREAICEVDLGDAAALVTARDALFDDVSARDALADRQDTYATTIRALPSGVERLEALLRP